MEIKFLNMEINKLENDTNGLKKKIREYEEYTSNLNNECLEKNTRISELSKAIEKYNNEIEEKLEEIKTKDKQIEDVTNQMTIFRTMYTTLEKKFKEEFIGDKVDLEECQKELKKYKEAFNNVSLKRTEEE
jgi:chromosome segregation ATPase